MEMNRDYWKEYYRLKRRVENGESREHRELAKLKATAECKAEIIKANWASLLDNGLTGGEAYDP